MNTIRLFDIPIRNGMMDQAVEMIIGCAIQNKPVRIFFVNAHCINLSHNDSEYHTILQQADFVLADGIGMKIASLLFRKPLLDNVNGTDMYPLLCQALQQKKLSVYLLGGEPGIAERMRNSTLEFCPDLHVCGVHHGFFTYADEPQMIETIRMAAPDVLLVALGVPKQEKWIERNYKQCGATVTLAVGGLFDFYSGKNPRAPLWMRKIGLEWLYRLYLEPRRLWKRYLLGNVVFFWHTIREWIKPPNHSTTRPA
ncbi:MAG: glycosyltransferase [Candidatus Omnitrophota bacterium]|jgi:N-acetylglucosaminyldiphosphoundecaprenol N-acetyl-beta-D-mannosaminyltransferase|nr:MAG: glycosyltransferase [Candidatus Omnitrophota bacterium]